MSRNAFSAAKKPTITPNAAKTAPTADGVNEISPLTGRESDASKINSRNAAPYKTSVIIRIFLCTLVSAIAARAIFSKKYGFQKMSEP